MPAGLHQLPTLRHDRDGHLHRQRHRRTRQLLPALPFNWGTKGLTAGTYQLQINLGDGVTRTVSLGLK